MKNLWEELFPFLIASPLSSPTERDGDSEEEDDEEDDEDFDGEEAKTLTTTRKRDERNERKKEGEPIGWVGERERGAMMITDCHIFSLSFSLEVRVGWFGSHSKPRERESYAIAYNL